MQKQLKKALFALPIAAILATLPLTLKTISQEGKPHWTYGGENNPTRWGELSPEYNTCSRGRQQSPINLVRPESGTKAGAIATSYNATPLAVKNTGHNIQVDYTPGSYATINGERYKLLQFHFHTPSEHTVNGKASAMEMHLVHQNDAGTLAVIGVLIEEGAPNPNLAQVWANIPNTQVTSPVNGSINVKDLLPSDMTYYHYMGSLTTPPCSEGVHWNVMTTPITASAEQIEQFMAIYQVNARPVQANNNRGVDIHAPVVPGLW